MHSVRWDRRTWEMGLSTTCAIDPIELKWARSRADLCIGPCTASATGILCFYPGQRAMHGLVRIIGPVRNLQGSTVRLTSRAIGTDRGRPTRRSLQLAELNPAAGGMVRRFMSSQAMRKSSSNESLKQRVNY